MCNIFSMLRCIISRKVKMQLKHTKKTCGDGAVTDRTCQKWFVTFHAGDVPLDKAPWLGRTVEGSDQMETFTENDQCYTTQETANILEIYKSIKLLVKMKSVSFISQDKTTQTFWPTQYIVKRKQHSLKKKSALLLLI